MPRLSKPARLLLACACAACHLTASRAQEPGGKWSPPPADGGAWKHAATGLAFPQKIDGFSLAGEFEFEKGGGQFVRYQSEQDRARVDIFFFPLPSPPASSEDARAAASREMDSVISDLREMSNAGQYKNLVVDDVVDSDIPLWKKESLPLLARSVLATRVSQGAEGKREAEIKLWIGVTILKGHAVTIRYLHPTDTGEQGEASLRKCIGSLLQIIKDPPLRAEIRSMIDVYMADPLSDEGRQAASVVLAYLRQTPFVSIPMPSAPLTTWIEHFKQQAPGTDEDLLTAFVLGSAKASLAGAEPDECVNSGASQFLTVYATLVKTNPSIKLAEVDELAAAATQDKAAEYLKNRANSTR